MRARLRVHLHDQRQVITKYREVNAMRRYNQGNVRRLLLACFAVGAIMLLSSCSYYSVAPSPGGATVTLYAAGVGSSAPTILATVMSDSNGNFYFISGSGAPSSNTSYYTCVPGTLLYAVASGGQSTDAGSQGGPNPSIKLMVALGPCGSIPLHFRVNELTTIAAVYALNAFRTIGGAGGDPLGDMTQLHGNSPAINNAFATAALLANTTSGQPAATFPPAENCLGSAPVVNCFGLGRLTALANALAACVRTPGGSAPCTKLFGDTNASDTLEAALFIARNPGLVNIQDIFQLSAGKLFSPGLSAAPTDWTISINFTGNGLTNTGSLAIDGSGNVWVATGKNTVSALSPTGVALPGSPYRVAAQVFSIAIDASGNVWAPIYKSNGGPGNPGTGGVAVLNPSGTIVGLYGTAAGVGNVAIDVSDNVWALGTNSAAVLPSGAPLFGSPFTVQGLVYGGGGIAIDTNGVAWIENDSGVVVAVNSSGTALPGSPYTGGGLGGMSYGHLPVGVAIDSKDNVWVANLTGVTELPSGLPLSPVDFTVGYILPGDSIHGVAIDGSDNVWVAGGPIGLVTELSSSGSLLSPVGFAIAPDFQAYSIAIDGGGDVWVTSINGGVTGGQLPGVTEFIGAASPTVTPLVTQIRDYRPPPMIYSIGGSVSGLASNGFVLQDNGGDNLAVTANGSFTFPTDLSSGTPYAVTILTQPAGQTCVVSMGSGTVGVANITNVVITCTTNTANTYTVGGTVTGLPGGATLTLQNNGGDSLMVIANLSFTFSTPLATGDAYSVTATVTPTLVNCIVINGSGIIGSANVTNVVVSCQ
jgi:hypothetical protein